MHPAASIGAARQLSQIERQYGNAEGRLFHRRCKHQVTVTHRLACQQQELYLSGENDTDEAEVALGMGEGWRLIMRQPGLVKIHRQQCGDTAGGRQQESPARPFHD